MKRIATVSFLFLSITLLANNGFAKGIGKTEVLRPSPAKPVNKGPFVQEPVNIKLGQLTPLAGKQESLKTFTDQSSLEDSSFFPLQTPIGPLLDENGDPILSDGGSTFDYVAYGVRFTSTMTNPRLDSVRLWFYVDSMEAISGNVLEVGAVKQRFLTHTDGNEYPYPDLGTEGAIGTYSQNHKNISRSSLKIATGVINSVKVSFTSSGKGLLLPEQDFCVYLNTRNVQDRALPIDSVITNAITVTAEPIGYGADFPGLDPEVNRTYRIGLDQESSFYNTAYALLDLAVDGGDPDIYAPNMFVVAYVTDLTVSVDDVKLEGNGLAQNFPNPFNPSTVIKYSVANAGNASLKVYNALGSEVASLVDGFVTTGEHEVNFDASGLPTGTYYYTLKSGDFTKTKHMVLSK